MAFVIFAKLVSKCRISYFSNIFCKYDTNAQFADFIVSNSLINLTFIQN